MLEELKEMLLNIFHQDHNSIQIISNSMGEDTAKQYPTPPDEETIDNIIDEIESAPRVDVVDVFNLEEEEKIAGTKYPKGSNIIMFKISDIRIKRRKIFRFGDYYVKLIHSGLNKWNFAFFTKSPKSFKSIKHCG